jgi:hypothetical protein
MPEADDLQLVLDVASVFPHAEGQSLWWESYSWRDPEKRQELIDDLYQRIARNKEQASG